MEALSFAVLCGSRTCRLNQRLWAAILLAHLLPAFSRLLSCIAVSAAEKRIPLKFLLCMESIFYAKFCEKKSALAK